MSPSLPLMILLHAASPSLQAGGGGGEVQVSRVATTRPASGKVLSPLAATQPAAAETDLSPALSRVTFRADLFTPQFAAALDKRLSAFRSSLLSHPGRRTEQLLLQARQPLGLEPGKALQQRAAQVLAHALFNPETLKDADNLRLLKKSLGASTFRRLLDTARLMAEGEAKALKNALQRGQKALGLMGDALSLPREAELSVTASAATFDGSSHAPAASVEAPQADEPPARVETPLQLSQEISLTAPAPDQKAEAASHQTGEKIDSWVLEELLGRGGFGEVWKARDSSKGREAVLKLPKGAKGLKALRREVEVLKLLGHESPLLEAELDGANPYAALTYIQGKSLRQLLNERRGKLPMAEALPILEGILAELSRLHDRGIVHRDLKPENVIIDQDGKPRVIDLGIARAPEEAEDFEEVRVSLSLMTREGEIAGTPFYAAPEQRRRETRHLVSPASDIHAAAVIFNELASKAAGDSPLARALHLRMGEVMEKAEAKDPAERHADARALLKAIARARELAQEDAAAMQKAREQILAIAETPAPVQRETSPAERHAQAEPLQPEESPFMKEWHKAENRHAAIMLALWLGLFVAGISGLIIAAREGLFSRGGTGSPPISDSQQVETGSSRFR